MLPYAPAVSIGLDASVRAAALLSIGRRSSIAALSCGLADIELRFDVNMLRRLSPGPSPHLERIPIGWYHPIDKNTLKINLLEHVLIGKVSQLFRNML
jgi:hypothetical protein